MQLLSPSGTAQSVPTPPVSRRTRRSPCPKTCSVASAWLPGWVRVVPPGPCSPFAPIAPDSGPSFCRAAPESLTVGRRTPLPHPSSFSPQPTAMGGVRPGCEENHERSRKVWAHGGHLPLIWDLPLFWHFPPLRATPLHAPPPSIISAPLALLWIRVTRGGVRMQSSRLQPHRSDPTSQWIGMQGVLWEHSEKHLTDLPLTSVGHGSRV